MSWYKYEVKTTSTGTDDASIEVTKYIDGVAQTPIEMLYSDWNNRWNNFDDMLKIKYYLNGWILEVLTDSFEGYTQGQELTWYFYTSVEYVLSQTPPPPPGFDIYLMNNTEELNKITKSPTTVRTLHGVLKEETDIVSPEILIEFDGTLTDCNYMYIPTLSRYYFITKITSVRNKLWRVSAHCDVLKTYSEGILGTRAVVSRNEKKYNLFLNDSMYKVTSNPRIQIANFPNKFEGESYVLVMNGANYTTPT